jgi:hypothetical protein
MNPIRPGYHWSQLYDLRGLPAGLNLAGATVTANLVKPDDPTPTGVLIPAASQSDGVGGANYANNRIIVEFTAASTAAAAVVAQVGRNALVQVFITQFGKTHVYSAGIVPVQAVAA